MPSKDSVFRGRGISIRGRCPIGVTVALDGELTLEYLSFLKFSFLFYSQRHLKVVVIFETSFSSSGFHQTYQKNGWERSL